MPTISIRDFVKRRSARLWIAFSLLGLIVLVKLVEILTVAYVEENWESIRRERSESLSRTIQNAFSSYQRETVEQARNTASRTDLIKYMMHQDDPRLLFGVLRSIDLPGDVSIEVFNHNRHLLAWSGQAADLQHGQIDTEQETSFVSRGTVYSHLTVIIPLQTLETNLGFIVVHRLFDVNYPFSNRFIRSSEFTQAFARQFDFPVRFDLSAPFQDIHVDGLSVPLYGLKEEVIGNAIVETPALDVATGAIKDVSHSIISVAVVFLSVVGLGSILSAQFFQGSLVVRSICLTAAIWIMRYLWLYVGFPSEIIDAKFLDPRYFASPFGFGLAKSIGELFITSVFLCFNIVYVSYVNIKHLSLLQRGRSWIRRGVGIPAIVILLAGLVLIAHRGLIAAVRSAVFDSTLKYNDPSIVFPGVEVGIMLLNILLLTLSFVSAAVLGVVIAYTVLGNVQKRFARWSALALVFLASCVVFGILHPSPLLGLFPRLLTLTAILILAMLVASDDGARSGSRFAWGWLSPMSISLIFGTSLIVAMALLDMQVHMKERQSIELVADELSEPVDSWLAHVIVQALNEMSGSEAAVSLIGGENGSVESLAFTQWAQSVLSRRGYNCSVSFFDAEDHLVSNFRIGIRKVPRLGRAESQSLVVLEDDESVEKRRIYAGTQKVLYEGKDVGRVEIAVSAGEKRTLRGEATPILLSSGIEESEHDVARLTISEYVDGHLVYTSGEHVPGRLVVPRSLTERLASGEKVWIIERSDNLSYETLCFLTPQDGGEVLVALRWTQKEWRWHVFDFIRYILFYALVCLAAIILYGLVITARGYRPTMSFRSKLLFAFFVVSFLPLVFLASYNRIISIEQANQRIQNRLLTNTAALRDHILRELRGDFSFGVFPSGSITDEWCEIRSMEFGSDFSIFLDEEKLASSKSELYKAAILEPRLSSDAFMHIILENDNYFVENRTIGSFDYVVGYRPLFYSSDHRLAVLAVPLLYRQVEVDEDLAQRNALLFGAYAFIMLIAVLVATLFAHRISRPIRQLIAATERISRGDLSVHIPETRSDELGDLHNAFNAMAKDLKRNREALVKAEREIAWKEMAKQVAHEIKNPLTPIRLSIQHLRQAYRDGDPDFPKLIEQISKTVIDQIDALSRIASQFAHFGRMPERREEDIDLREIITEVIKLFDEMKNVAITFTPAPETMTVRADREELRRALINVVRNSVQAMSESGVLTIESSVKNDFYTVTISDTGPGIPEEILPRLFEPNFSTKSEGMGLGLAIVKKTIDDLRGKVEVRSKIGDGTFVTIFLPRKTSR
jgi:two-component system nitrogen regulation sensor histidine kinase NtrY